MDDINFSKNKAGNLRKKEKYQEAVELYETIWEDHKDICNEWDGWNYAFSLRKIRDSENAYRVSEEVLQQWPNFEPNHSLLSWCIYDKSINRVNREIKQNEAAFFNSVNRIMGLAIPNIFSPFIRTIFKVVDYLEESRTTYPAESINNWLEKLDPSDLSLDTWQGKDQRGKSMEHASDRERWYSKKTKALYSFGKFQECIDTGEKAIKEIPVFHYQNDKWIKRLIALSLGELKKPEEGITWLDQIMDDKAEWFLYYDKASLLNKIGDMHEALKFASFAALDRKEISYKCNVFLLMGKILLNKEELDLANQHLLLAAKIRLENEWSISDELQGFVDQTGISILELKPTKDLVKDLRNYWQSLRFAGMDTAAGTIKNIVKSGKSGFISGEDGEEYYFKIANFQGNPKLLNSGIRVTFFIQKNDQNGKLDTALEIKIDQH